MSGPSERALRPLGDERATPPSLRRTHRRPSRPIRPTGTLRVAVALAASALLAGGCGETSEGDPDTADASDTTDTASAECDPDPVVAGPDQVLVELGDAEANPFAWPIAAAHGADGALLETRRLSCALDTALTVPAGGSVSILDGDRIETVMGVAPGETIRFGEPETDPLSGPTVAVRLPAPTAGIVQLSADTGCEQVSPQTSDSPVVLHQGCAEKSTFDVLGTGISAGFFAVGWSAATDIDPTSTSVDLPAWNTDFDTVSMSVDGLPESATEVLFECAPVRGGVTFQWPFEGYAAVGPERNAILETSVPIDFADAWSATARVLHTAPNTEGAVSLYWWPVLPGEITAFDATLDAETLPHITSYAIDAADPRQPKLSWALDAPLPFDFGRVALRADDDALWQIIVPPGASSPLVLPQLPDEMAGGRIWNPFTMILVDSPSIDDYAAIRPTVATDGFDPVRPRVDMAPLPPAQATRWAIWTPLAL